MNYTNKSKSIYSKTDENELKFKNYFINNKINANKKKNEESKKTQIIINFFRFLYKHHFNLYIYHH